MQNKMNKVLSVVLACIMVLGLLPVTAMATQTAQSTVEAWNLVLADEIAVNFHVSIENAAEDAVMRVTDGYATTDYPLSQAEKTAEGNYLFTGRLAAAQMADEITLQLISGEEAGEVHTYTAAQYAEAVLTGEYKQSAKDLVLAMINYGAAAQNYFDYNTEKLANAGYEAEPTAEIPAMSGMVAEGNVSGLSLYGASLLFQSRIAVRFYFTGSVEGLSFSTGTPVEKNGLYYVDVNGINPQDYDKEITLTVTDGADTLSVSYSPLAYISRQYAKSSNEALRALVANMYQYHIAAENYLSDSGSGNVTTDGNGIVTEQVILSGEKSSAVVAAGTKVAENTTELTLSVAPMDETDAEVELAENESLISMDVHVEGISEDNTVPVLVTLDELAPEFLNKGNIALYHVENGVTVEMTRVYSAEELDAHNEYYYDIATGTVTVALASFSEVTVISSPAVWKGSVDHSWYDADAENLYIYNADQLHSFAQIVGGIAENIARDTFAGQTITLHSDIDLNDAEASNVSDKIFYPIGYYYTDDNNADGTTGDYYSTVYTFAGTFDGNGHTISNFYQNTWEIKGDYDGNYYKDAMGLFGYVNGGKVKNLTVDHFSSDGEFTPTGVIAAYANNAAFENIAITNCNPRVYNTGNGGIIGIAGNSGNTTETVTLTNITVDNSNKITALWGSWDVACGGLVGMFRGNDTGGTIHFENCHVGAVIDVYNDVCANYQYYAYRYAGMIIGSVRNNVTGENGRIYPNTDGITASGCTVHYDTWNDYYYCELVANTLASYTHDHQFSRLLQVTSVDVANMKVTSLEGVTTDIPTSGRYNYVVVNGTHATENATCYHFVNGEVWNHADAGTETVNGEVVLKEDNQHIYLPFAQLFTGYSWGVTSAGIGSYEGIKVEHVDQKDSVNKFKVVKGDKAQVKAGCEFSIRDIFAPADNVYIDNANVKVFVSPVKTGNTIPDVSAVYTANTENWQDSKITFSGTGLIQVSISDYYYCTTASVILNVVEDYARVASYTFKPATAEEVRYLYKEFGSGTDSAAQKRWADGTDYFTYIFTSDSVIVSARMYLVIENQAKIEISYDGSNWETVADAVNDPVHSNQTYYSDYTYMFDLPVSGNSGTILIRFSDASPEDNVYGSCLYDFYLDLYKGEYLTKNTVSFQPNTAAEENYLFGNENSGTNDSEYKRWADESNYFVYRFTFNSDILAAYLRLKVENSTRIEVSYDNVKWREFANSYEENANGDGKYNTSESLYFTIPVSENIGVLYLKFSDATEKDEFGACLWDFNLYVYTDEGSQELNQTIFFVPATAAEKEFLVGGYFDRGVDDETGKRWADQDDFFTYKFTFGNKITAATLELPIANQAKIEISSDGENWVTFADAVENNINGLGKYSDDVISIFYVPIPENTGTIYIRFSDADPDDGFGGCLRNFVIDIEAIAQ